MNKLAQLFKSIDKYCTAAALSYLYAADSATMPDDPEEFDDQEYNGQMPTDTHGILQMIDDISYDIKGSELLANQLDQLKDVYTEFISGDLDIENAEALNTVLRRIEKNTYLQLAPDDPKWQEPFPPIKIMDLFAAIKNDASKKMQETTGDDTVDIADSTGILEQFNEAKTNNKGEEYTDTTLVPTGNKIQQTKDAIKRWRQRVLNIGKLGPGHAEYEKFEKLRAAQKRTYQNIQEDPVRKAKYNQDGAKRFKLQADTDKLRFYLINKINAAKTDNEKESLIHQLAKIEREAITRTGLNLNDEWVINDPNIIKLLNPLEVFKRHESRLIAKNKHRINEADKIRGIKKSGTLPGLIIHLQQKLATEKNEVARSIKKHAANDPYFKPFKDAVRQAKENFDKEPSTNNQNILADSIRKEAAGIKNYLENHDAVSKIKNDLVPIYEFRNKTKELEKFKFSENEAVPEVVKTYIHHLIESGEKLIAVYGGTYRSPCATIRDINKLLRGKL